MKRATVISAAPSSRQVSCTLLGGATILALCTGPVPAPGAVVLVDELGPGAWVVLGIVSGSVWHAYTPTWSGTLGNGTLTGACAVTGDSWDFRITLVWGSTTSHPAGGQNVSLPAATHADYTTANVALEGWCAALDASAGAIFYGPPIFLTPTTIVPGYSPLTNAQTWGQTVPFTWATGDKGSISGRFQSTS